MEKIQITGTIDNITFQNDDNGYTVFRIVTPMQESITCVGTAPAAQKGVSVILDGNFIVHKKFGRQFEFKNCEVTRPTTESGITYLLESGLISNIGSKRAKMIVDKFGLETLNVLDNAPEKLTAIPGIGGKTLEKIKESWAKQKHIRDLVLFLQEYDISAATASRVYKAYGNEAKKKICENPYALIEDVRGIGFITADAIAMKLGIDKNSYKRIKAGLVFSLSEAAGNGHTFLPRQELEQTAATLLDVAAEQIVYTMDNCVNTGDFAIKNECVYLQYLYRAESEVAKNLSARIAIEKTDRANDGDIENFIAEYGKKTGWQGAPEQEKAIKEAAKNNVFVLTGGPGTGKTTVLQVIVAYFREQGKRIELAAPTGRAAARMGSISGIAARTIHRLLEFKPNSDGGFRFAKNAENPIDADVIILDEASMIDIVLAKSFFAAVKPNTALIIVGDSNQLPSVGPGCVLFDLISCPHIPHVELTKIFRQSAASRIVTAAHEIIKGNVPQFSNSAADNCFLIVKDDPQECLETIVDLTSRRLSAKYDLDPMTDIQVLSPMHKGTLGTVSINAALQNALNKSDREVKFGQNIFRCGDRVLQTRNNYEAGVFNGDIGFISNIDDGAITILFDKTPVTYEERDYDQIVPAYCISIHKSQGSEFRAVIMPVSTQHFIMLQRNLIYTGLTRAKELCVFVGTKRALKMAVENDKALARNSNLSSLIFL